MKILLIVIGVLAGLFAVAQFLQLLGVFGVGFSIPGVAFTILGGVIAFLCLKKAFAPPKSDAT
ncbi:MAG: hypothetical protein MI741_02390 [Rhodospirillales bacterium]|nr:hypothetical protein [Rhodospirillales bacterium]